MEIGGSQINAVQLAAAVRDLGHEVIVLSEPGPMVDCVRTLALEHLEIQCFGAIHPSMYPTNSFDTYVSDVLTSFTATSLLPY